jgi:hypothetical protein
MTAVSPKHTSSGSRPAIRFVDKLHFADLSSSQMIKASMNMMTD